MVNFITGLLLSTVILVPGKLLKGLKWSGLIAGIIVGTGIYYGFRIMGFVVLLFFFVTGTLLSKLREKKKKTTFDIEKGGERDLWQVLANGGIPLIGAILYTSGLRIYGLLVFAGSMATVTADTWATETGIMFGGEPVLITTGKKVKPGVSGGITLKGTIFSLIGSIFIGFLIYVFKNPFNEPLLLFSTITGGIIGAIVDSFIGATLQRQGYCTRCKKFTEKKIHDCGEKTKKIKGINWVNNDVVNFVSSICGALFSLSFYLIVKLLST